MLKRLKKIFAVVVAAFMLCIALPTNSFATDIPPVEPVHNGSLILNTNNPEVGIEIYISNPITTFAYREKSAWQSGRFYLKSDNSTLGEFKTTGTFTYDGAICNVTDCQNSIWNVADGWRVEDTPSEEQVSPTLAKAVGVFNLYKEGFWGDTLSSSATITVSCNQNGKTNCEFNGDEAVN